jgi:hypothetical protein
MPASSGKPTEAGVGAGRDATGKWSTSNSKDNSIIRKAIRSRSGNRVGRQLRGYNSNSKDASKTRNQQQQKWEQGGSPAAVSTLATARIPAKRKPTAAGVGTGRVASGIGYTIATARMPASSGKRTAAKVGTGRVASGIGYTIATERMPASSGKRTAAKVGTGRVPAAEGTAAAETNRSH